MPMPESRIDGWKDFEINGLRKACYEHSKEFVVLDNNLGDCLAYFETMLLKKYPVYLKAQETARQMIGANQSLIERYKSIVLLDCDRTLSNNDTTYDFCVKLRLEKSTLKDIFRGEHYSLYQFFRTAKFYASKDYTLYTQAASYAATKSIFNQNLIHDIKENGSDCLTMGITSGIFTTWQIIQKRINFPNIVVGGSNVKKDKFLVSREVKYWLVYILRKFFKYVIAVGDSMIDIDMLNNANVGFIVAQEKINTGIKNYITHNASNIMQLEYNKLYYDGIKIKRSIFV
jgi:phosphoserine phosphatase